MFSNPSIRIEAEFCTPDMRNSKHRSQGRVMMKATLDFISELSHAWL
jgi:hypothetical protein